MQVTIIGAGAVGGVLGALLARAGNEVSFLAQGESLRIIRAEGIHLTSPSESFSTGPLKASDNPAELGKSDLVIVCVKSWQVEAIAPTLAPLLGPSTVVVPTQNGVEAAALLADSLGEGPVLGGLCHVFASRESPGRVRYVGNAPSLTIGERKATSSERVKPIAAALQAAGITVNLPPDIEVALWNKLLFVEAWGSVGAVARSPVEVIRSVPETRALLEQTMREVQAVAKARGIDVPDSAITQSLARLDAAPNGAMASMHRDIVEGRPSELSEQTGAVVRLGAKASVPVPAHSFLWAALLPQSKAK